LGPAPARTACAVLLQRLEHRVSTLTQETADALHVRLEQPARQELVQGRLGDETRSDVGGGGEALELRRERGRDDQVADAKAGRHRLRERRAVPDVLPALELEQARQRRALEADEPA